MPHVSTPMFLLVLLLRIVSAVSLKICEVEWARVGWPWLGWLCCGGINGEKNGHETDAQHTTRGRNGPHRLRGRRAEAPPWEGRLELMRSQSWA